MTSADRQAIPHDPKNLQTRTSPIPKWVPVTRL